MDAAKASCFHCGGALPDDNRLGLMIDGVERPMCCAGCRAAAELVLAQGLARFYDYRSGTGLRANSTQQNWSVFDRAVAQRRYTRLLPDRMRQASLQIEGLHCTACGWLIENSLRQLDGVLEIHVNPSSARAELRFDPARLAFSRVLERIHTLGYIVRPMSFTCADADDDRERRLALQRLAVAGFGMMQVMTFAVSLYAGALQGMDAGLERFFRLVSLLVATPVVLFSAQPFFIAAWRSVRMHTLGMDVPVALSIGAAYLWSVWTTLIGEGTVYFDSAVMFTFFLLLGRYIEMSLRHRSGLQQHALARLLPNSVLRVTGELVEEITPEELVSGDRVRVPPGQRVPADGAIETGNSEFDESLLTGESAPRLRGTGDIVTAGTLNLTGAIEIRVTRVGQDSTLAEVSRLLERAQLSRPLFADLADRVAAWFVGAVLLLAGIVAVYWWDADATRAFATVLAVLVVTCPCALSLATPAALAAATNGLARAGLLVTRARALERLAAVDCVVFDKTGTLTRGQPRVERVRLLRERVSRESCLSIAAALERHSSHPIARAFAGFPAAAGVSDVQVAVGRGIEAVIDGIRYRIGRLDYALADCRSAGAIATAHDGMAGDASDGTIIVLADTAGLLASFSLVDALREDSTRVIEQLRELGLSLHIASGDRAGVVNAVARQLRIVDAHCNLDAAGKVALVHALQTQGRHVAMIGDGVNDAPVLAAADLSIATGDGTDLAKVSADMVLLGEALGPIVRSIKTARATRHIIRQNLAWAALYNATAVPLAAIGWLQPWMAAIGMSASSLLVVLNALRLLASSPAVVGTEPPGDSPLSRQRWATA